MRYFQILTLTLLTAIVLELGLIVVKLPTPEARAALSPSAPMMEDPHEALKRQVAALEQQMSKVFLRLDDDSKRLLVTCVQVNRVYDAIRSAHPGHFYYPPLGDLGACTAGGWSAQPGGAQSWRNFEIPFGP